jgi:hypothetical protein
MATDLKQVNAQAQQQPQFMAHSGIFSTIPTRSEPDPDKIAA